MQNLALVTALAEQRQRQCPCVAVAGRLTGLCRKCQARKAWRRKTTPVARKSNRRRHAHRARNVARFLADVLTLLPTISNGMEG